MSDPVPADQIETLVGARRHPTKHIGRASFAEQIVFMLHSAACREQYDDLTKCPYARASDNGITPSEWPRDVPVYVAVGDGHLMPLRTTEGAHALAQPI